MESCYIPNNPQFGLALEYTAFNNGASFTSVFNGIPTNCDAGIDTEGAILCCNGSSIQGCSSCGVGAGEDLEDPLRLACDGIGSHCCDDFQNCDACNLNNCEDIDNEDEFNGLTENCDSETLNHVNLINHCEDRCSDDINSGLNTCAQSDDNRGSSSGEVILGDSLVNSSLLGTGVLPSSAFWTSDDMASFSLPSFDLDPLPGLFPFSPSSTGYNPHRSASDCRERSGPAPGGEVADVLLSLKHAVVHAGQGSDSSNTTHHTHPQLTMPPQMVLSPSGGSHPHPYYEQYSAAPPLFPTVSLNVSMNMTMHGYAPAPDQMCPQMQWNQNAPSSPVNIMYPQTQNVLSSSSYPGAATYSFTADFRTQNQTDPLITASTTFKPLTVPTSQKTMPNMNNYNLFSQRNTPPSFSSYNTTERQLTPNHNLPSQIKTRSSSRLNPGIDQSILSNSYSSVLHSGSNSNLAEYGYPNLNLQLSSGGNIQIESPSLDSGSDDELKPNLCRICGKTYARPSTLKTHLRTHSGERPYRCGDCNKSFSQAANLTAHVRTHTGQKPFRCPICDRRFSQSSSVTTHMRTHSGERPYRCRACKKAFSDSSTLTKHLRIHSGEKPYQCKLCLLRFSQSGNLNRHMRVHGNNSGLFT